MSGDEAAARIAAGRISRVVAGLAATASETVPRDVRVEALGDGIAVSGRRLRERALTDTRLRNIGR